MPLLMVIISSDTWIPVLFGVPQYSAFSLQTVQGRADEDHHCSWNAATLMTLNGIELATL